MISGAFKIYQRRWKLFVGIALLPSALMLAVGLLYSLALFGVMMGSGIATAVRPASTAVNTAIGLAALVTLLAAVAWIAVVLYQYKCHAMIALGALDVADGKAPAFAELSARTKGVMGRTLSVVAALGAAVLMAYLILGGIFVAAAMGIAGVASSSRANSSDAAAGALGLMGLGFVIALVIGLGAAYLTVRWLYFVPVLGAEGVGGFAALKRSMALTKGSFWRTFGYYLIASIAVSVPLFVVQFVGSLVTSPIAATMNPRQSDPMAFLGAMAIAFGIQLVLQFAVMVFTVPLMSIVIAVMYRDQMARDAGAVAPAWGGVPGYGAPAGYGAPYGPASGAVAGGPGVGGAVAGGAVAGAVGGAAAPPAWGDAQPAAPGWGAPAEQPPAPQQAWGAPAQPDAPAPWNPPASQPSAPQPPQQAWEPPNPAWGAPAQQPPQLAGDAQQAWQAPQQQPAAPQWAPPTEQPSSHTPWGAPGSQPSAPQPPQQATNAAPPAHQPWGTPAGQPTAGQPAVPQPDVQQPRQPWAPPSAPETKPDAGWTWDEDGGATVRR